MRTITFLKSDRRGSRGGGGAGGARPPLFAPNSLKSPLNWLKKILGASPRTHSAPSFFKSWIRPCLKYCEQQRESIFPLPVSRLCYHRSLAYKYYICLCGHLGRGCLRFKPHWMFRIYLRVSKNWPLVQLLAQFGQRGVPNSFMAASNHIVSAIREFGTQWHQREILSFLYLSYQRKQASFALRRLSSAVWLAGLEMQRAQHLSISLFKIVEH